MKKLSKSEKKCKKHEKIMFFHFLVKKWTPFLRHFLHRIGIKISFVKTEKRPFFGSFLTHFLAIFLRFQGYQFTNHLKSLFLKKSEKVGQKSDVGVKLFEKSFFLTF